ncbi:MAG: preprotein translocase subunit YajC [Pseudomonadota bacterium]
MLVSPAYAQTAGGGGGDMLTSFIPIILIFVIFYFFLIRPQQKKQKEHQNMVNALRRNDQVLTQGGIYGKVTKVKEGEDDIEVEIAEGVKIRVLRSAVGQVISKTEPAEG